MVEWEEVDGYLEGYDNERGTPKTERKEKSIMSREIGKFTLTYGFWLPWRLGFGRGWGCEWFDFGPITIYWSDPETSGQFIDDFAGWLQDLLLWSINKQKG